MNFTSKRDTWVLPVVSALLAALLATMCGGCASPLAKARYTSLVGDDLVAMTDDMAMKIMGAPAVRGAIAREGKLRIVISPVENYMTAEVLPAGQAYAFVARLRALLAVHAPNQFIWIMNRDAYYYLRDSELEGIDPGPNPDSIQPEYALGARFDSMTTEDPDRRASYYLCVYFLTNLRTRDVLWTDKYEVRKSAVKGFLD
jgi:hypothetical protein